MSLDPTRNFLKQTLATGYSLSATAITLPDVSKFPNPATEGAFNIIWWNVTDYPDPTDDPSKEVVRVTAISGSIATITRAQEGTTATAKNLSGKTYQIALALTKKTMDDIDTALETVAGDISTLETRIDTAESDITQIEADLGVVEGDIATLESSKQDTLGFTPENVANKENTTLDTSTTKYPTNRLVKEAVDAKQNSLGFTPENIANKSTDVSTDGSSDTKYPSVKSVKDYADALVTGAVNYRSGYDASTNTFPTTGGSGSGGSIKKGNMWIISVAGTLGGEAVSVGDSIIANVNTPGQTASNWNILNSNITYVPEDVANKATTVTGNESSDVKYPSVKSMYDWATGLFTPQSRTITINGVSQDLSSNRSWTITSATASTGITDTSGTWTANISTGVSGGQSIYGGTGSGNNLTIYSTSHATKGKILFGTSAYDEVNNRLGIRTTSPTAPLHINFSGEQIRLQGDNGGIYLYRDNNINSIGSFTGDTGNYRVMMSAVNGNRLSFWTDGAERMHISGTGATNGNVGFGTYTTGATARLELPAGAATASKAPLKFLSGTNLTTPEAGAMEYDGTSLFFTPASTRYNVLMNNYGLSGGQTIVGGTASGNNLTIYSTSHATKGKILFGTGSFSSAYDEANIRLGIGTASPNAKLSILDSANVSTFVDFGANYASGLFTIGYNAGVNTITSSPYGALNIVTGGNQNINLVPNGSGKIGIGTTSPTAMLHIKAGTASANTAPLKFTTGTNLTTAEAGVMEYNNTPHFTNSDATRRHIVLSASATKTTAGAPYTNDGYIILNVGGTDVNVMTTA